MFCPKSDKFRESNLFYIFNIFNGLILYIFFMQFQKVCLIGIEFVFIRIKNFYYNNFNKKINNKKLIKNYKNSIKN